jgi:NTE family protein
MHRPCAGTWAAALLAVALATACATTAPQSPAGGPPPAASLPPVQAPRPKIGLVLGGGGARGFAHIGVMRVLEQEKIPIDVIVGTSVGSLIGALYADTGSVLDCEYHALTITQDDLFDYGALSLMSGGFVKGEKLERFLERHLKNKSIEAMAVPFAAVAVDLRTGGTAVLDRGSAAQAVHASAAIPGVFVPVEMNGRTYVDGGVTNPVPVDVARRKGADVVIAVAIPAAIPAQTPRNPVSVVYHAISIMAAEIGRLRLADADVAITPEVGDVAYDDFSRKKELIDAGTRAAKAALPAIRAAIERATAPAGEPRP